MAEPQKVYLDENGEPIKGKVYLTDNGETTGEPSMNFATVNGQRVPVQAQAEEAAPSRMSTSLANATSLGPAIGATVGGLVGGVPGAAVGGAAGVGFEGLARHARELPGAAVDVARNLISHPRETIGGFAQGAKEGAMDAGISGAVNGAMEGAGNLAMGALSKTATGIYRGYLKPSLAGQAIKDAQQIVKTALEEALPISSAGVGKANARIHALKAEVDGIIKARLNIAKQLYGDIDLHDVADRVRQYAKDKYFKPGRPMEDYEAAMRVADNIDAHPSLNIPPGSAPGPLPRDLEAANEAKRTLQSSAGDRAFGVERTAATEAEKKGAYELRKEVEYRAPAVGPLNARESKLIDTAKAISRAVEREANQNSLVGVKTVLAVGAGGAEYGRTGDPYTAAAKALALRAALKPEVASKMAIVAFKIGQRIPGTAPASAARLALAALQGEGQKE